MTSLAGKAGYVLNRIFSWNPSLATWYLTAWATALELLSDQHWLKRHVGNNLRRSCWPPAVRLKARRVELVEGVAALLTPAPGSLSFRALYERRVSHEPGVAEFLKDRLDRYDSVLEIGANVGLYTLLFSKCMTSGASRECIFAYEPSPRVFALLKEHITLNQARNVLLFNCAVASTSGTVSFRENSYDWMKGTLDPEVSALFLGADRDEIAVPAVTGDEIAPKLKAFSRPLFKIDVMGAEPDVLGSLHALILEKEPDLVLGVWFRNLDGLNRLPWLRELYDLFRIEPQGLSKRDNFSDRSYCNYFLKSRKANTVSA